MKKYLHISLYILSALQPVTGGETGKAVYDQHCASCHESATEQIPVFNALQSFSAADIRNSLVNGTMRQVGINLSEQDIAFVAEYISGSKIVDDEQQLMPESAYCKSNPALPGDILTRPYWNGWGVDLYNSRYQPAEKAGLDSHDIPRLKLKWVFAYPGETLTPGQPNVIGERIFVSSQSGNIYSLDAHSGCLYWQFKADASVRTAISIGENINNKGQYMVFFTDMAANVYALDAHTGKQEWKVSVESHPGARVSGAPLLYQDRIYVPVSTLETVLAVNPDYRCCTHRGSIVALDSGSGNIIWKSYTISTEPRETRFTNANGVRFYGPSGAGIWSAPTIDAELNVLYAATGENSSAPATRTSDAILAMDLNNGEIIWSYQATSNDVWNAACLTRSAINCPESEGPDYDFGSSPVLAKLSNGKRVLLAAQKSGEVHALDPDNMGKLLWKRQASPGGLQGGVMWGPATDNRNIYIALSERNGVMTENTDGTSSWKLDANRGGGLIAYRISDGKKLWHTPAPACTDDRVCSPAQSAAISAIPGIIFSGSYDGYIRAYSMKDGDVIWEYDTVREYNTVNEIKARGGALDGPGAVIVNGMLYVNSGYGRWGGMPGNALLAFSKD